MNQRARIGRWGVGLSVVGLVLSLLAGFVGLAGAAVQGRVETPQPGSRQSGIGLVRGWVCQASQVEIDVDDGTRRVPAVYGEQRGDTQGTCGDINNGFSYQVNWSDLGEGTHTIRVLADGEEAGTALVVVATMGETFLRGAPTDTKVLVGFPESGNTQTVQWQEADQRFVLTNGGTADTGGSSPLPTARLESPAPGSFQSGIGLVRGFVCQASQVEIELDGTLAVPAVYGEQRGDTQPTCGDIENGFSYQVNWNEVSVGKHTIRVLTDGQEIGTATFTVATLGVGSFVQGLTTAPFPIADFPEVGASMRVLWDESLQNFQLFNALPAPANPQACTSKGGTATDADGTAVTLTFDNPCLNSGNTAEFTLDPPAQAALVAGQEQRAQNEAGSFFLCGDLFSFTQDGRTFGPGEFRLLDWQGKEVCGEIAAGERFQGVIAINASSDLNFNAAYTVSYNNQPVVSFPDALPPMGYLRVGT